MAGFWSLLKMKVRFPDSYPAGAQLTLQIFVRIFQGECATRTLNWFERAATATNCADEPSRGITFRLNENPCVEIRAEGVLL